MLNGCYNGLMELHKQSLLFATYVSKELKATLVRYDASMAEAAKATKHSRTAVTNWLNGRNQLPLRVLYEICEYVGVKSLNRTMAVAPRQPPAMTLTLKASNKNEPHHFEPLSNVRGRLYSYPHG